MVRKDIVSHTRLDPRDRVKAIKGFIANVKESPEATEELKKWNLHIGKYVCSYNMSIQTVYVFVLCMYAYLYFVCMCVCMYVCL